MAYSVSTLLAELQGSFHGTNLNQVVNIGGVINRTARELLTDFDPLETVRIVPIASAIFDQVYDYPAPPDLKGDRIIDIRPQVNRTPADKFFNTYNENFDRNKGSFQSQVGNNQKSMFTVQYNTAVKTVRVQTPLIAPTLLNAGSTLNQNGTWGGTVTNLTIDNINYVYGGGSLEFTLPAIASPVLTNSTQQPIDLTQQLNQGMLFVWVYIPTPSKILSFTLQWGSDAGDYWSQNTTSAWYATTFQVGWNLIAFDWHTATMTGAPNVQSITYLNLIINTNGTGDTNFRVNQFLCQLGEIYQIEYYSKFMFRDATTGNFQETYTNNTNLINLDTDSYNLFFNCVAYLAAQQIQGTNSSFDLQFFQAEYQKALQRYTQKIKSQTIPPQYSYYDMPNSQATWIARSP